MNKYSVSPKMPRSGAPAIFMMYGVWCMVRDLAIWSRNVHVRFQSCLDKIYVASFNNMARQTVSWLDYTYKECLWKLILAKFTLCVAIQEILMMIITGN